MIKKPPIIYLCDKCQRRYPGENIFGGRPVGKKCYACGRRARWYIIGPPEHDYNNHKCWCSPYLYYTTPLGNEVWIHALQDDGPSPEMLAEAIVYANMDDYPEDFYPEEVEDDN